MIYNTELLRIGLGQSCPVSVVHEFIVQGPGFIPELSTSGIGSEGAFLILAQDECPRELRSTSPTQAYCLVYYLANNVCHDNIILKE